MPQLGIVRTGWSGTTGGPGLTQLAFREDTMQEITAAHAQTAVNAVRAFWNGLASYLPNEVTLTVQPVVDVYDALSGDLVASKTAATPPASVAGTDTGAYAMGAGIKANLQTGIIRDGRRVRGAIYIVPAGTSAYANTGLVAAIARTAINTNGATMLAALVTGGLELLVWSRPTNTTSNDGDVAEVTSIEGNEKTAVLRGRRD